MGDIVSLKTRNLVGVLSAIKRHGSVTKSDISDHVGITSVSAHNIVNDLLQQNVIKETDTTPGSESGNRGRAVAYELNPDFGYVVGQRMIRGVIETAIYSFDSKRMTASRIDISTDDPNSTIQRMIDEIKKLIGSSGTRQDKIMGVGVTWPGQVDFKHGVILHLPNNSAYQGIRVKQIMRCQIPFPIFTDNDNKGIVRALKWLYTKQVPDDFVYFACKPDGVGSAMLSEGKLLRGHNNNAGEIGHIKLLTNGARASIENLLQENRLVEKCKLRLEKLNLSRNTEEFGLDEVISMANDGNEIVLSVLREALAIVMIAVDIFVKIHDPGRVMLDIEWLGKIPALWNEFTQMMRENFPISSYSHLVVEMCDTPNLATLGAATLLFDDFFTNKTTQNELFRYCGEILKRRDDHCHDGKKRIIN
jgi:predicted NBD/HSP70 family sugar kinase